MIVFLTGTTGAGKTDTSWALVSALDDLVFLDCDWFASRAPFSWKSAADVDSVYRAIRSQIAFHRGEGRTNFVVTLTLEMAAVFEDNVGAFGLPVHAFRLVASNDTMRARIIGRDRMQKTEELENALQQQAAFERLNAGMFTPIETDGLDAQEVAKVIFEKLR